MAMTLLGLAVILMLPVGLWLFIRGWRGEPELSQPHCAKCGYDLRIYRFDDGQAKRCPECGSDLSERKAVVFGKWRKRPRQMIAGAVVAALPFLLIGLMVVRAMFSVRTGMPAATKSNAAIIAGLPQTANSPWDWQELERRYKAGQLSNQEMSQAIEQLISYLDQQRQKVGNRPLFWCGDFVKLALGPGGIPAEQELRLCRSFYGPSPTVTVSRKLRPQQPLRFRIDYGSSWNLPGVRFVKALREVRMKDGKSLTVKVEQYPEASDPDILSQDGNWSIDGAIPLDLPPGEYEMSFTVDAGVVPEQSPFVGLNNRPGQKQRWVKPLQVWTAVVPCKFTVLSGEQAVIQLVQDPKLDPVSAGAVSAPRLLVKRARQGVTVSLTWQNGSNLPVPIVMDLQFRAAGRVHPAGMYARWGNTSSYNSDFSHPSLPPDITRADLILQPNAKMAEQWPEIEQIWGRQILFENVPLERYDVDPATEPAAQPR